VGGNRVVRPGLIGGLLSVLIGACGGGSGSPQPSLAIGVSPASVLAGQPAVLTWSSDNASTCQASGAWAGTQATSGKLQVTQADPGSFTYTLACSSGSSAAFTGSATLTVTPQPLAITGTLSNGVVGVPFSQNLQATGGVAPFAWVISSGALPQGLSQVPSTTNTVTISGTPSSVAQAVAFTVQVTDAANQKATQLFTVSILLQADTLVLSPPAGLNFGAQLVGTASGTLAETLTNSANSAMAIDSAAIVPGQGSNAGEFTQSGTTCASTLTAGASCAITVDFTPAQPGPRSATLTLIDDTAGSPQSVSLSGVGLGNGPNATLSALSLPFGVQRVGTTSPTLTVTLSNYGSVALNIGNVTTTAGFSETNTCVPSLASAGTCTISVTFTPAGAGNATGTLSISDDAASSPQTVALSGTGSTTTSTLSGACVVLCAEVPDSAACPVGAPANHPVQTVLCPVGPTRGETVTVDGGRACFTGGSTRAAQGFCGVQ
jgi:hypothetical protein